MASGVETPPIEDIKVVPIETSDAGDDHTHDILVAETADLDGVVHRIADQSTDTEGLTSVEANTSEPGRLDERSVATGGLLGWLKERWQQRIERSLARGILHRWAVARKQLVEDTAQRNLADAAARKTGQYNASWWFQFRR